MDFEAFKGSPAGRLVSTTHGQQAFVPDPLPPKWDAAGVMMELSETMQAVGNLNGISWRLPNPYMVIRPLQRQEALTSSSMEGTHASPDDLVLLEAGEEQELDESAREVLNYIKALNNGVTSLSEIPISHRMIKRLHGILLSGLSKFRGSNKRPGEYKVYQNFIGGNSIESARFIPTPPDQALIAMDKLEQYMNDATRFPPIIDAALTHYQFETIHPFADGNGRVGRILLPLFLMQKNVLSTPILYISPYIEKHKDEYIDRMYEVSRSGDWESWVRFFLTAVQESCSEATKTIDKLLNLQVKYRERAHSVGRSGTLIKIVDSLFEHPALSIPDAARIADVTYPAAQNAVNKLIEADILKPFAITTYPRRFVAREVVMISAGISPQPQHAAA